MKARKKKKLEKQRVERANVEKKEEQILKKEIREDVFEIRMSRHYEELKWLYWRTISRAAVGV